MGISNFDIVQANGFIGPFLSALSDLGINTTGRIYYVSNNTVVAPDGIGGSNGNDGLSPQTPFADIDYAVGRCTANRGDVIVVMPGHSETLTTAITCDVAGVSIVGFGDGDARPQITVGGAIDGIDVTAVNTGIYNLYFNEATAAATANINVAAANCKIQSCHFDLGANDAECITLAAASADVRIANNDFIVTANGPTAAIEIEDVTAAGAQIVGNFFNGGSVTNTFDSGAINSGVVHTLCLVYGNRFLYGTGINFTAAATGFIVNNFGGDPYDVGSCELHTISGGNLTVTQTAGSGGGSGGGGGEPSIPPTTGSIFFVDSSTGAAGADASHPSTPEATIDAAVALCTHDMGDIILVMPNHAETLAAAVTVDIRGVSIIGLGQGNVAPTLTVNGVIDGIDITASDATIDNIAFAASTAAATSHVNIAAANVELRGCEFLCGANDAESITITAAGLDAVIHDNVWRVTADGPNSGITVEAAAVANLIVQDNYFDGGTLANSWDDAAILSAFAHTNCLVKGNTFTKAAVEYAIEFSAAATGAIVGNNLGDGIVDPGSCLLAGNTGTEIESSTTPSTTGRYIFVDSTTGSDATNLGYTPSSALATLDAAIGAASVNSGDTILVMPGHQEVTTTTIAVDTQGLRILGLGVSDDRPTIVPDATAAPFSVFTVSVANCTIENIIITAESSGNDITDQIHINTGVTGLTIKDCLFLQGANDPESIYFAGTARGNNIEGNRWIVVVDGPNRAIQATIGAISSCNIENNVFDGGSIANSWDDGIIVSDQANVNLIIRNNVFSELAATMNAIDDSGATATGLIEGNIVAGNDEGVGIVTSNMTAINNYVGTSTGQALQAGIPQTTGKYIYCSSTLGTANGNGLTPLSAIDTLDAAIGLCGAGVGNTILVMPGHTETLTLAGQVVVDLDGIKIVGLAHGDNRPIFIPDNTAAYAGGMWTVTGDDVWIENIIFSTAVAAANGVQSLLEIATGGDDITIKNCRFDQGQYDLIGIDFPGTADNVVIEGCEFVVGANGPTSGIANDNGVTVDCKYLNNSFNGGSLANAWDNGGIYSTQINTGMIIDGNKLIYGAAATTHAINLTAAATGIISNNIADGLSAGFSIDPGSCTLVNNFTQVAPDSRAVPFPTYSEYNPRLGYKVTRSKADVLDGTTTPGKPVFTVAGGRVMITHLEMEVVDAALGAAANVFFHTNPTVGTDQNMCALLAVGADEDGSLYSVTGDPAVALTGGSGGGAWGGDMQFIVPEGTINVDSSADTNVANSALESFEVWYIPLDSGAVVTAV